jgi:hypothetical protein
MTNRLATNKILEQQLEQQNINYVTNYILENHSFDFLVNDILLVSIIDSYVDERKILDEKQNIAKKHDYIFSAYKGFDVVWRTDVILRNLTSKIV